MLAYAPRPSSSPLTKLNSHAPALSSKSVEAITESSFRAHKRLYGHPQVVKACSGDSQSRFAQKILQSCLFGRELDELQG